MSLDHPAKRVEPREIPRRQRDNRTIDRLAAECVRLERVLRVTTARAEEAEANLAWLAQEARSSRYGVTVEYCYHAEEGRVQYKGYRIMRYHFSTEILPTLGEALVAARNSLEAKS